MSKEIEKLSAIIQKSPNSIITTDKDGIIDFVNPAFETISGFSHDEICNGKELLFSEKFLGLENLDSIHNSIGKVGEWTGEFLNKSKEGKEFWESATIKPILDEDDNVLYYMKISEDISSSRHILDMLTSSYSFIESVMDNTNPIFVCDNEFRIFLVNKEFLKLTQYKGRETIGEDLSLFLEEDVYLDIKESFSDLTENSSDTMKFETLLCKKNNEFATIEMSITPLFEKKKVQYIVGTINDITKEKESAQRLKLLFHGIEQSPATIIITDVKGIIEYVNPKFTELTGYSFDDIVGENSSVLKSGLMSSSYISDLWNTINSGKEWVGEFHNIKKNGDPYWERASISPIFDESGEILHFIAIKEDITGKKINDEALKLSEENLRKKNEAMNKELEYAYMVVKQLLPVEAPQNPLIEICYRYLPMEIIGGDFFSFKTFEDESLGFFLGDVSGHGVSAALFLSLVKSLTEKNYKKYPKDPLNYIKKLNEELLYSMSSYFLTAVYGVFEKKGSDIKFTFVRGAHPPPILFRSNKKGVELLKPLGKPIGMFEDAEYEEMSLDLKKGDRLYLYTDGINETINSDNELLGFNRLSNILVDMRNFPLETSLDMIIDAVENYRGDAPIEDDVIIMGFEIK